MELTRLHAHMFGPYFDFVLALLRLRDLPYMRLSSIWIAVVLDCRIACSSLPAHASTAELLRMVCCFLEVALELEVPRLLPLLAGKLLHQSYIPQDHIVSRRLSPVYYNISDIGKSLMSMQEHLLLLIHICLDHHPNRP